MSSQHFTHPYHHPEYAPPVLRVPSPASSVGTTYGPDQTSFSDTEHQISQTAFEQKWLAKLDLDKPTKDEEEANASPLIPRTENKEEQDAMVEKILKNLRVKIQELEEDEIFEQTLLRGSQIGQETRPSTNDIDVLMKSMMASGMSLTEGSGAQIFGRAARETLTDGPWIGSNRRGMREGNLMAGMDNVSRDAVPSTAGKRSRSGKTRRIKVATSEK